MHFGDMHEIIYIVGKINDLPDILKALFLLQGCVELRKLGGVKVFQTRRKEIQLVHVCPLDKRKRHINRAVLRGRIAVNEKILRVISGNADVFHGFVKLLCCGRHGKPHAARCACFKTGAAVNQNRKLLIHGVALLSLPGVLRRFRSVRLCRLYRGYVCFLCSLCRLRLLHTLDGIAG